MEGCSKVVGSRSGAQEVAIGVWDAPPQGVVERLIQDHLLVSTLRLLNSHWRGDVDGTVRRVAVRDEGLSKADIEERVAALAFKFPRIEMIGCVTGDSIGVIGDVLGHKLLDLAIGYCDHHHLELLPNLSKLETLRVGHVCDGPADLVPLSTMTRLTEVHFHFITNHLVNVDALGCLTNLKRLGFQQGRIETLFFVEALTKLVDLRLTDLDVNVEGFGMMSGLTNLTILNLKGTQFGNDDATCLSCLINLKTLTLDETKVRNSGFRNISRLTGLSRLSVSCENITEAGCDPIGCLMGLQALTILLISRTLRRGRFLSHLTNLRSLSIGGHVQNGAMSCIASLMSLTNLRFNMSYIDNNTFTLLGNLDQLKEATLSKFGDRGVHSLSEWAYLPKLRRLRLFGYGWVDQSLVNLSRLVELEVLELESREITNNAMLHLTKLRGLKELKFCYAKVSKLCGETLKEALPLCSISGSLYGR